MVKNYPSALSELKPNFTKDYFGLECTRSLFWFIGRISAKLNRQLQTLTTTQLPGPGSKEIVHKLKVGDIAVLQI